MRRSGLYFHKVRREDKVVQEGQELSISDLQSGKIIKATPNTLAVKKKNGVIKINLGISNLEEKESGLRTNKKWTLYLIPEEHRKKGMVSIQKNHGGGFYPLFSG